MRLDGSWLSCQVIIKPSLYANLISKQWHTNIWPPLLTLISSQSPRHPKSTSIAFFPLQNISFPASAFHSRACRALLFASWRIRLPKAAPPSPQYVVSYLFNFLPPRKHAMASALFITVRKTPVELPLVRHYYRTDGEEGLEKSTKQKRKRVRTGGGGGVGVRTRKKDGNKWLRENKKILIFLFISIMWI